MRKRVVIAVLVLVSALAGILLWPFRSDKPRRRDSPKSLAEREATPRFLAFEQAAREADETIWTNEVRALEFGEKVASLWDQMRQGPNPYATLRALKFTELLLPVATQPETLGHGISRRVFLGPGEGLSPEDWRGKLDAFERDGFVLEQSDWRQIAFSPSPAKSVFAVGLHVLHRPSETRFQISFDLEIGWKPGSLEPEFDRLQVRSGRILSRTGPPFFTPWFSMELPLVRGLETLDPVLSIQDLDADGRPEVALPVPNLVLRPKGERFAPDDLCAKPAPGVRAALFGDFDRDGRVDLLCATREGLCLYRGTEQGTFPDARIMAWLAPESLLNPFVMTSGDIDGDGDLDIFLAQYKLPYLAGQMPTPFYDANDGFPAFLLLNDGHRVFSEGTIAGGLGPKRNRRTYSASFVDLDRDHDLDLIVVSDFYGIDVYLNDGAGHFSDQTSRLVDEPHAFGMAHAVADFNLDGALDVLMIGMNSDAASRLGSLGEPVAAGMRERMTEGNRLYLQESGRFQDRAGAMGIARAGWALSATVLDFDGDAAPDVYVVNGHNSRQTAMDYESQFWRHDVAIGKSEHDPAAAMYFQASASRLYGNGWSYGGFYKNKFYLNEGGTNFLEIGYLAGLAMEEDGRNVASVDLDGDGDLDLVLTTLQQWPEVRQRVYAFKNEYATGRWAALALDPAYAPGTVVEVDLPSGRPMVRTYVTGDSYRSQHSAVLQFSCESAGSVPGRIWWPNHREPQAVRLTSGGMTRATPEPHRPER